MSAPVRALWQRLRRLCTVPYADADQWADWLTATHVLEDGLNPAAPPGPGGRLPAA